MGLTISQLSAVTALATGDQIVVWSSSNGDTRKASLTTLLSFFESNFASPDYEVQTSAPTSTGFTMTLTASTSSIWAQIESTGAFAAGTVTLPPVADAFDGQQILITCSNAITALTVSPNGASTVGVPVGIAAESAILLRYSLSLTRWFCVAAVSAVPAQLTATFITATDSFNGPLAEVDSISCTTLVAATSIQTEAGTVAALGSAANKGVRKFVTDSNAALTAGIGAIVAGGGANNVPVISDGTNWRIG